MRTPILALAILFSVAAPAMAEESQYQSLLTLLLSGNQTIIDQTIAYPGGTPNVTAAIVEIQPGKDTGWHIHAVPLYVYVMEGEITVDYGSKGTKIYKAGDSLLEAENWPHNGMNRTDLPVRLLAVYMGAEGVANAEPVAGAK